MTYVAGALLSIVVIVLLVGRPGVRKLVFVSLTIFGLALWYFFDRSEREEAALHALTAARNSANIEQNDLQLDQLTLVPIAYGGYELNGVVTNNSKIALAGMDIHVALSDCLTSDTCHLVGQREISISLTVLPGQKAVFKSPAFAFANLPMPAQNRIPKFDLIGVRAE